MAHHPPGHCHAPAPLHRPRARGHRLHYSTRRPPAATPSRSATGRPNRREVPPPRQPASRACTADRPGPGPPAAAPPTRRTNRPGSRTPPSPPRVSAVRRTADTASPTTTRQST